MSYNGWSNYETWLVNLWLGEEDYFLYLQDLLNEGTEFKSPYQLSLFIKDYIEEQNPLADQCTMYSDLLSSALSKVDYREIAKHYWENLELDNDDDD